MSAMIQGTAWRLTAPICYEFEMSSGSLRSIVGRIGSVRRDKEGAALVEGSVLLPVLLTISFGVFEFSHIFYEHHIITNGIRDAARYVARRSNPLGATTQAQNLATTGSTDGSAPRRISWWVPQSVLVETEDHPNAIQQDGTRPYRGGDPIKVVHVRTDAPFPGLGLIRFLGLNPPTMTISHRERVIGE